MNSQSAPVIRAFSGIGLRRLHLGRRRCQPGPTDRSPRRSRTARRSLSQAPGLGVPHKSTEHFSTTSLAVSPSKLACKRVEEGPGLAALRGRQEAYALQIGKGLLLESRIPRRVPQHTGVEDLGVRIELRFNHHVAVGSVLWKARRGPRGCEVRHDRWCRWVLPGQTAE